MQGIFSNWPQYSVAEINAAKNVLESGKVNYWTGSEGRNFETEFANFHQRNYSIALANGTVALQLAMHALDIGPGDEVIVTSRTFIASVSAIVLAGAIPIFADVDLESQNINVETITPKITNKTKAILCVHLAGWPCEMDEIIALAKANNLAVIEDCAQAHGAAYNGKLVGTFGDVSCWSFCQDKIMSTGGEGGMITTNSEELWQKMWSFKDHGKNWNKVQKKHNKLGFRWLHESFGSNYRMTEMQAAIGRLQLQSLPSFSETRRLNLNKIWAACGSHEIFRVATPSLNVKHAAYKCYVFVNGDQPIRDNIMAKFLSFGVPCFTGSCSEVYLEKAFIKKEFMPKQRLQNAKFLGETSLMFLCDQTITKENMDLTCDVIDHIGSMY